MTKTDYSVNHDFFRNVVWRRKWVAASVIISVFASISILVGQITPRYTAEALLLLSAASVGELNEGQGQTITPAIDPFAIRSEVEILTSDELARRVIHDLNLAKEPEFQVKLNDGYGGLGFGKAKAQFSEQELRDDALLTAYKKRLAVFNDGRTLTIRLGFTAQSPRLASEISNAHAAAFLAAQAERRIETQKIATKWLNQELETRAAELREAENAAQSFRIEKGFIITQGQLQQQSSVDQELNQLNEQLTKARGEVAHTSARLAQMQATIKSGVLEGTSDLIDTPVLVKLRQREAELETQVGRLTNLQVGGVPAAGVAINSTQAAKVELASVQETIKGELERLRASLVADVNAAVEEVALLTAEMTTIKQRKLALDQAQIELRARESIVAAKKAIYEATLRQYTKLISEEKFAAADAKIVSRAAVPTQPSFPKSLLIIAVSFCLSIGAGAAAAYGVEWLRPEPWSLEAIAEAVQLPGLATLPLPRIDQPLTGYWEVLFCERVRALRSALLDFETRNGIVILVTSAMPKEGKSLVALSLARTMQAAGVTTMLVDGDLRQSGVSLACGLVQTAGTGALSGLGDVLSERVSLDAAIHKPKDAGFSVLPAGVVDSIAIEGLATEKMHRIIAALRERYDAVIIDSPPLEAVADALAFSAMADRTVFITRPALTPLRVLRRTLKSLQARSNNVAGLILTGEPRDEVKLPTNADVLNYYVSAPRGTKTPRLSRARRLFASLTGKSFVALKRIR